MKKTMTVGKVKKDDAPATDELELNLNYEGQRVVNSMVECKLPATVRGDLIARLIVYAQDRLEQVAGEIEKEVPESLPLARTKLNDADLEIADALGAPEAFPAEDLSFLT